MVDAIAGTLFTATAVLASIARSEVLCINEDEARKIANAAALVADQYDGVGVDPRALAWGNFAMVAGGILGPRVLMYMSERAAKKEAARRRAPVQPQGVPQPGNVHLVQPH